MQAKLVFMSLELNVECPNSECENYFNLFNNEMLRDDGFLHNLVCSNNGTYGNWGCKEFQKQLDDAGIEIHCPKCGMKIEIESVEW